MIMKPMSEEDAIKTLKLFNKSIELIKLCFVSLMDEEIEFFNDEDIVQKVKYAINIIINSNKNLKEIEIQHQEENGKLRSELNQKIILLDRTMNNPDYICKDKIKLKIEKLEKDIEIYGLYEECWPKIQILKELMEDSDNE